MKELPKWTASLEASSLPQNETIPRRDIGTRITLIEGQDFIYSSHVRRSALNPAPRSLRIPFARCAGGAYTVNVCVRSHTTTTTALFQD